MICPPCQQSITDSTIRSEFAKLIKPPPPRARVMRPCKYCGVAYSARELRIHRPHCACKPQPQ